MYMYIVRNSVILRFLDAGVPDEYLCPITREIMKDPVICTGESFIITPAFKKRGVYCFRSASPSVRNQHLPSHFSQQPCITATSNLAWCFG